MLLDISALLRFWIYTGKSRNKFLYSWFVGMSMRRREFLAAGAVVGVAGCLGSVSHVEYSDVEASQMVPQMPDNYIQEDRFGGQLTEVFVRDDDEKSVAFDINIFSSEAKAQEEREKYGRDAIRITDLDLDVDDAFWIISDDFAKSVVQDSNVVGVVFGSERELLGFRPDLGLSYEKAELMVNHWKSLNP